MVPRLRRQFAQVEGFRITADEGTRQIFVLGPAEVHASIQRILTGEQVGFDSARTTSDANEESTVPSGASAESQLQTQSLASRDTNLKEAFLPFSSDAQTVERRIVQLFGSRLRRVGGERPPIYRLMMSPKAFLDFHFDVRRQGVHVTSTDRSIDQFRRLVVALDGIGQRPGQRVGVVSIERTDRSQLGRAVEAFRGHATQVLASPGRTVTLRSRRTCRRTERPPTKTNNHRNCQFRQIKDDESWE
jgi:hypothetical protein